MIAVTPSLYAHYLAERCGFAVLECEEGFATYAITVPTVYIMDMYVVPSARRNGVASRLADQIGELAKVQGCTELSGSIDPLTQGSHESLLVLLAYGMRLSHISGGLVYLKKSLD